VPTVASRLQRRNQEIGSVLARAREQRHRSVTECASVLATSRRRYSAIERGEVAVSSAELELLMVYLESPTRLLWQGERSPSGVHHLVVQAPPGKTVQVEVRVQG
jgi:transcriptional regulator with XRE-family HTH domain